MVELLFVPLLTILVVFFLGYGLTAIAIPNKYFNLALWLSPWFLIIFLILFLTVASLAGFSVKQISPVILFFLVFLNFYAFFIIKKRYIIDPVKDILLFVFIGMSILLNLSPLILKDKLLTTLSLGNNDVISYATTADYLVNNSIGKSFPEDLAGSTSVLLHAGYRWGTPIIESFFLYVFQLPAYKLTYLIQVILYSLMVPLVYVFLKVLFKSTYLGMVFVSTLTIFNANLLYMLYHDFFGQVLYWGLSLFFMIWLFIYLSENVITKKSTPGSLNKYDIIIGTTITVIFFSYHEPTIILFSPLLIYILYSVAKRNFKATMIKLMKISTVGLIGSSISFMHSIILNFAQAFNGTPGQVIGWELFRSSIPFANPFELMGFYSIHSFEPIWFPMALLLSLIVIGIMLFGLLNSKSKLLFFAYIFISVLMFYFTAILRNDFFAYNRAVTYTIPFFIVLFAIGVLSIPFKKIQFALIVILMILTIYSGLKLNKKFIYTRYSVDKSFISLQEVKKMNIQEPIYTEAVINPNTPLWRDIWMGYFLYPSKDMNFPKQLQNKKFHMSLYDNSLAVVYKNTTTTKSPKILFKKIIYENDFYRFGRICDSSECLLNATTDLSEVISNDNPYGDTLLLSGWSINEGGYRWTNSLNSTLRLVLKNSNPQYLLIEAQALKEPEVLTVVVNNTNVGEQAITTLPKEYRFRLDTVVSNSNIYEIEFYFSNLYKPSEVLPTLDNRDLAVKFIKVKLE